MFHELGSIWIFGNSTGMLASCYGICPKGICLRSSLELRWKSGINHPVGPDVHINVEDQKSFCEALYQLQKLKNEIDERDIVYSSFFYSFVTCTSKVFLQNYERFEPRGRFKKKKFFLQVDRFISKDLNGGTCMHLIDDLVITEESKTIYLVIGN